MGSGVTHGTSGRTGAPFHHSLHRALVIGWSNALGVGYSKAESVGVQGGGQDVRGRCQRIELGVRRQARGSHAGEKGWGG